MAKEEMAAFIAKHGITMNVVFVPFSKSRNKNEKHKTLNWVVTILKDGREIVTTDYSAGIGHLPAYKAKKSPGTLITLYDEEAINYELENGKEARRGGTFTFPGKLILPDLDDVLYSLALDSDVLNYSNFEDWAPNLGYDADSRKAEKIYRACLEIALKLRNGLGDEGFRELEEAARDF